MNKTDTQEWGFLVIGAGSLLLATMIGMLIERFL